MDHTGINGRAAKPHEKKAGLAVAASRKQKDQKARRQDPSTQADHTVVADPLRKEAADCPSGRDPQIEKTGQGGGAFSRDLMDQDQIAAGPESCRGLQGIVAEKHGHRFPGHGDP